MNYRSIFFFCCLPKQYLERPINRFDPNLKTDKHKAQTIKDYIKQVTVMNK